MIYTCDFVVYSIHFFVTFSANYRHDNGSNNILSSYHATIAVDGLLLLCSRHSRGTTNDYSQVYPYQGIVIAPLHIRKG
jgi:hypothetical protein